ncbi:MULTISPECIES: BREX-1 system phosphatase PglZ type A [Rhizobium]|uniref:BREX-1 system phosphatase PglZ type A n=1 Tax=Rhizobium TaxID=379 RepID=UPI00037517F6|nr:MULTISPECIES: BREX-1 system phosphatase PglZ type A [Rhizobium]TBD89439.1 BREX-1 system phosphatase PglZ type A [Rhizobium ruizarguesonis]UFW79633.1 BREX-1 system phosphatase PglZ type A [Rhizobium leguminosarum bv. viciae]
MDLTHIQSHLRRLFNSGGHEHAGHRVVYWHDQAGEFVEELDNIGIGELHEDGVCLIHIDGGSTFSIKFRVLMDEPNARFVLYQSGPQIDPDSDFLLDIKKWAAPFAADRSTMILRELGLVDELALKPYIADRTKYFGSRERLQKLQRFVTPGDDEFQLDLKILAVLAKATQSQLSLILRNVLSEADPEDWAAENRVLAEFERFDMLPRFWEFIAREFRYQHDKPSVRNLLMRLFVTDFARHVSGSIPQALQHLILPNGGGANAVVFMDGWRDSSTHQTGYDHMSASIAEDLRIRDHLSGFSLVDLTAVDTFIDVEKRIASLLTRQIDEAAETVNAVQVSDLAKTRQDAYWANRNKPTTHDAPRRSLHAVYDALIHASNLLTLKGEIGSRIRGNSANETWQLYTGKLFRIDQLYRLFSEATDIAEGEGWDILKDLRQHVEDVYGNWYLAELGSLWTGQVQDDMLQSWSLPATLNQYDFFRRVVKPILENDPERRVVVIVSDAFRYEAAHELFQVLNGQDRIRAKLDAMVGVLPSYTALGMASLLPHERLGYASDGTVLVDGKSSSGLDARNKILGSVSGVAVKASDLMDMKKDKGKEFFRPYRVIYVYHDQIDQTADRGNEEKTFAAVRTSIEEINALVRRAFTFNCNFALVTSDHGFLFQNEAPGIAQKNAIKDKPAGTLIAKKRYLIGKNLGTDPGAMAGHLSATAKVITDTEFWVPKGINRFHFVGGSRFVHGGAMPQEICVPLLRIQYSRGEGKERERTRVSKIGLALLLHSNRITTSRHRFTITQTEAITARRQAVTVRIALFDEDVQISNAEILTFDSSAADMNAWKRDVWLTLVSQTFDSRKHYKLIVRDTEDQLELVSANVTISLAFDNDF